MYGFHGGEYLSRGLLGCDASLKHWYPTATLHRFTTQKTLFMTSLTIDCIFMCLSREIPI